MLLSTRCIHNGRNVLPAIDFYPADIPGGILTGMLRKCCIRREEGLRCSWSDPSNALGMSQGSQRWRSRCRPSPRRRLYLSRRQRTEAYYCSRAPTKYDIVVIEVLINVAVIGRKLSYWCPPVRRIWLPVDDILRHCDSIEVPYIVTSAHSQEYEVLSSHYSQTAMPSTSHFIANTPPPPASKVGPYDA